MVHAVLWLPAALPEQIELTGLYRGQRSTVGRPTSDTVGRPTSDTVSHPTSDTVSLLMDSP